MQYSLRSCADIVLVFLNSAKTHAKYVARKPALVYLKSTLNQPSKDSSLFQSLELFLGLRYRDEYGHEVTLALCYCYQRFVVSSSVDEYIANKRTATRLYVQKNFYELDNWRGRKTRLVYTSADVQDISIDAEARGIFDRADTTFHDLTPHSLPRHQCLFT